jgi:hypothetical protein
LESLLFKPTAIPSLFAKPSYPTIPLETLQSQGDLQETENWAGGIILLAKGSAMMASQRVKALSRWQSN